MIEALRETEFPDVRTPDAANFAMARLVYNLRMLWHLKGNDADRSDPDKKALLDKYNNVRQRIAAKLRDAEARGQLEVRAEFEKVAMRFALGVGDTVSTATTNWDGTVAASLQAIANRYGQPASAKPIHGTSQDATTLYLPSEMVGDRYRDVDEDNKLGGLGLGFLQAVAKTQRIVIYGLSLSPLDAELGEMINLGLDGATVREICIIDPWYTGVAERVQMLVDSTRGSSIPIRCFHPTGLDDEWVYDPDALDSEFRSLKQRNSSP